MLGLHIGTITDQRACSVTGVLFGGRLRRIATRRVAQIGKYTGSWFRL